MQKVRDGVPVNCYDDQRLARGEGCIEAVRQDVSQNGLRQPELAPQVHNAITAHATGTDLTDYTTARGSGSLTSLIVINACVSAMTAIEAKRDLLYPHLV